MAEAVKVIVRCRPMNTREKDLKCKCVVNMDNARGQCSLVNPADDRAPPKPFTFDGAYFTDSTTEQIYADIAYPLVEGVTEGYNGTIFAYGQTGCGKSFSMQGITDPATQRGIIPRAFDHIFETISCCEGVKFLVHASYLEIYNEEIRDLLGVDVKKKMDLHEHPDKGVYVQGLSMHPVHNVQDCEKVMGRGWKNRSTGATLMNADSSRSHSIFTINLEMCEPDESGEEHIRAGKLNLVDLAGSERQGKTGATGDRLKEATKINLSLSALGNVISALVDGKSKHIPYRDSKLTRLLQDSLGGNTKTLMVACLSPADNNYDETLSTLRYANRAKNIKNKPKINEDPKDALLRQYQEEIEQLKAMLMGQIPVPAGGLGELQAAPAASAAPAPVQTKIETKIVERVVHADNTEEIEAEKRRIREEFELQLQEMNDKYEQEKTDKAKLADDMDKLRNFYDNRLTQLENTDLPPSATADPSNNTQTEAARSQNDVVQQASSQADAIPQSSDTQADSTQPTQPVPSNNLQTNVEPVKSDPNPTTDDVVVEVEVGENGSIVLASMTDIQEAQHATHIESTRPGSGQQPPVMNGEIIPTEITNNNIPQQSDAMSIVSADGLHTPDELMNAQKAVHIGTTKENGELVVPSSSPTAEAQQNELQQEAMKRLQALQEQMVGGEAANNSEVKERRKKRKKHAEEKKRKLAEAMKMDDDGIMLGIYDSVQDELKAAKKLLEKENEKVDGLEREIVDIQSEFEFDRIDYLDTIRKQDQQLKLQQSLIDKMHPCIRRDCNYSNLDRVRAECKWDEENQKWSIPPLLLEKTSLPPAPGGPTTGGRSDSRGKQNGTMRQKFDTPPEEDRFRQKLQHSEEQEQAINYFKPKRASQLLSQTQESRNMDYMIHSSANQMMNGNSHSNSSMPWNSNNNETRAAAVHGQTGPDDFPVRKPARLDALPSAKGKRKKKSALDPL